MRTFRSFIAWSAPSSMAALNTPPPACRGRVGGGRVLAGMWRASVAAALLLGSLTAMAQTSRFAPVLDDPAARLPASPANAASAAEPQVLRGASPTALDYAVNADIDRLVVEVAGNNRPADGQTPTPVVLTAFAADGAPLKGKRYATVEVSGGRIRVPGAGTDELGPGRLDLDRATAGTQIVLVDGVARFELLAPAEPQDVLLRVTAGGQSAQGVVSFVPDVRDMLAVGLIEGVINLRDKKPSLISPTRNGDGFEQEIRRWERSFNGGKANGAGRVAFFLKGKIKGDALLTAAYDSDKETRARLLRDIRPEEFYPVYGDASIRGFDARSAERVYLRIDQERSYLLYGDFQTGDAVSARSGTLGEGAPRARSLGTYNRTVTGFNWHPENERVRGNVFAFRDSLRQVVEEFPSQGSGPYGLRNQAVLEGSERVEVIARDRNQPSRILSVRPLLRFADYSFEPFSGRVLLSQFLPAFDAELNPMSLRITYEVDQGTEDAWVYGGDAQVKLLSWLELGGSYVKDENPFAGFEMGSVNASVRMAERTHLVGEWARAQSEINTNPVNQTFGSLANRSGQVTGDAWRMEFDHAGEVFDARLYAGRSDPEFNNPSSPLYGGRAEYSANLGLQATERVRLYAEGLRSEDRNPQGGHRTAAGAGARVQATDRLSIDLGARSLNETLGLTSSFLGASPFSDRTGLLGSVATGSAGGALGFGQQPLDPLTGLPVIGNGLRGNVQSNLPVGTRLSSDTVHLGLGYRATDKLGLSGELETAVNGEDRDRFALGADYQLRERQRLYTRYEQQTGLSSPLGITTTGRKANAFTFGTEQTYLRDTQVYGEYRLRDAISGRDIQAASGVRTGWDIAEGVRISSGAEHVNVISGNTGDATAVFFGIDYTANPLWRGSTRVELRRSGDVEATADDERFDTALWQLTVARKLDRDWTLLGRNYLLLTDYAARGDVLQNRFQVGVAYRDNDRNRVNALMRYEYKLESDESGLALGGIPPVPGASTLGNDLRVRAHIVSAHSDWHPSRPWWLTGRIASKWQHDRFVNPGLATVDSHFRGLLLSGRAVYDFTENWDIGVLGSVFSGDDGARQYAYGAEIGRLIRQNLWLSLGYNWSGFDGDADLSGYEYTQQGVFLRIRFKFDENLFKSDPYATAE